MVAHNKKAAIMIDLSSENYKAIIAPSAGGSVLSLQYGDADILRRSSALESVRIDPREAACFPCVPYFGRVSPDFTYDDKLWNLSPTLPACDSENALHGEGWISPWEVTARTKTALKILLAYKPRPGGFPFEFEAHQNFSITENNFTISLSVLNTGRKTMPAGLALHPYFNRNSETQIRFASTGLWNPPSHNEKGRKSATPEDWNFSKNKPLPDDAIDHSFLGVPTTVFVTQPTIDLTLSSNSDMLHVYAPTNAPYFCLEPITHLPGQFGKDRLSPGETKTLTMHFNVS